MAISEQHAPGSCKAAPASRCNSTSNRNRNRNLPQSAPLSLGSTHASLLFVLPLLAAMLTSCLALPFETTTNLPSVDNDLATTIIPPQQQQAIDVNSPLTQTSTPTPTVVAAAAAVNESLVEIEPLKTTAAEVADEFVHTSFVSLGGEGLEQGIRNAVKSEVELEIEADSSGAAVEPQQAEEHADNESKTTDDHVEHTDAAQGVREPKTLDAEAETEAETEGEAKDVKATHAVEDSDKLSVEAEAALEEQTEKAVEEVASNNDKATLESTPEVKAEKPIEAEESQPEPVTDKSLVVDNEQVEPEQPSRPLPSVTSDLVSVIFDENRAITEQPITTINREALEHEHEKVLLAEEKPEPTFEETKHQVTKKQGVEDLLPIEVPNENVEKEERPETVVASEPEVEQAAQPIETEIAPKATTENAVQLNEIEDNIIDSDANDKVEQQPIASSSAKPELVESTEATVSVVAPVEEVAVEANKPVDVASIELSEESLTPTEANIGQEDNAEAAAAEVEVEAESKPEPEAGTEQSVVAVGESSSTASPAEPEAVEVDKESEADSDESEQKTEQPAIASVEKDSSEESDEQSDEPKAKAEDSTATPLVSYPPHNAGQTFDSNLADERSAYLSLSSSNRSTLIIALCSGTAVIFIVISLVIFVLSFQRQHGTLDIEMQEQRLGKDTLDEEDAQMKLLDVDLSTPVIIAMGNEETDECL